MLGGIGFRVWRGIGSGVCRVGRSNWVYRMRTRDSLLLPVSRKVEDVILETKEGVQCFGVRGADIAHHFQMPVNQEVAVCGFGFRV